MIVFYSLGHVIMNLCCFRGLNKLSNAIRKKISSKRHS